MRHFEAMVYDFYGVPQRETFDGKCVRFHIVDNYIRFYDAKDRLLKLIPEDRIFEIEGVENDVR